MRNSKQRDLILQLVRSAHTHPTADWVYNEARKQMPNISLGTVYRNLGQLVDNKILKSLKKIGWIIPTDSYQHKEFVFTHNRLREDLAARYIWNNWDERKEEIFLEDNCLLHFLESNKIFDFAFSYGKYLQENGKIEERIVDIIGDVNSLNQDEKTVSLRAPFLGFYLAGCMGLEKKEWYLSVKEFIKDTWVEIIKDMAGDKPHTYYLQNILNSVCFAMVHIKPWITILPKVYEDLLNLCKTKEERSKKERYRKFN